MAKFLNTTGVSYHLEELIKSTKYRLILISPYLQFNERIKENLENLHVQKKDIRIIYRENKLHPEEQKWLQKQIGIRTSNCKNLHAKCYLNEHEAIITSMNLYAFSQQNNNEMGIYFTKSEDPELYSKAFEEVERLLTISEEIRITVEKVKDEDAGKNKIKKADRKKSVNEDISGFCIRTGVKIPFDILNPLSPEAMKVWKQFSDKTYPEKFCHYSGEKSNGETSFEKPVLKKNWKKSQEL